MCTPCVWFSVCECVSVHATAIRKSSKCCSLPQNQLNKQNAVQDGLCPHQHEGLQDRGLQQTYLESRALRRGEAAYGAQALGPLPPSGHLTQRSCFQDEHGSRLTEALGSLLIQPQPPEPPVAPEPFVFEGGNGRMFPPTHLLCGRPGLHIWAAAGGGAALPGPRSPNDKKTESCQRKAPQPLGPLGAMKDGPQFP